MRENYDYIIFRIYLAGLKVVCETDVTAVTELRPAVTSAEEELAQIPYLGKTTGDKY